MGLASASYLGDTGWVEVFLVDGTFELFRAFYSAPSRKTSEGREVGATIGWFRSLLRLLRTPGLTHAAVAFDHVIESFRNELFDGYKTGDGIDPELWQQAELVERVTEALGVVCWPMIEFEADDALASAAARFAHAHGVERVVIASPDKDLAQCVTEPNIILWDRIRDSWVDSEGVRRKFGVAGESIPDFLALVGDTADGIPGLPRWGKKGAATILARYTHLEQIPRNVDEWDVALRGKQALSEILFGGWDDVLLYRKLATLRRDVPLGEALDDLRYRGASRGLLPELIEELSAPELLERVEYAD